MGFLQYLATAHSASFVQNHDQVHDAGENAKVSEDVVAGAATHGAIEAFEKHYKEHGKPSTHQQAKDMLTRFTTAEVDKSVSDKGLYSIDKAKVQKLALQNAEEVLSKTGHYQF